jgi:phage terminase Nu1 subunit (DNA packaging protein)
MVCSPALETGAKVEQKKDTTVNLPEPRELNSWKEIAQYLGVNIRTAQKWERERGLPIHRGLSGKGPVRADTKSVDAWRRETLQVSTKPDRSYRWPLASNLSVEARFVGSDLTPRHIDVLKEYLDVLKAALT